MLLLTKSRVHVFALLMGLASIGRCKGAESTIASPETVMNPIISSGATKLAHPLDEIHPGKRKRLTEETMSPRLRKMEYAVRGEVVIKADEINEHLQKQDFDYPFDHIVYTNIGNPHSLGQKPLTWPRQVIALVELPDEVLDDPNTAKLFPPDAIRRAKEIKIGLKGMGTGAYTHSKGAKCFRDDIAHFIQERDEGVPCDPEDIFMTNGASAGITMILQALMADETCGCMIPIPQYPIYSATIDLLGGHKVGYYLDEKHGWDLNMKELERAFKEATDNGINVNSFVLINPGNPTGQVLSKKVVQDVVRFCANHNLVLLADEVYQENVYGKNTKFYSCKHAAYDTGLLDKDAIELVSFHSTSKGIFGECGRRGGYMEVVGLDPKVEEHLYKLASSSLCSTVSGQIMMSLMVRGPKPGDESYESHEAEKATIFDSLKRRSKIVSEGLDSIHGISCQPANGAMYCFPKVKLPQGAIEAAKKEGVCPDTLYALSLLESTGVVVVPASGFGQEEGRYGFRTTFLPPEEDVERMIELVREHHRTFCDKYKQ
jgi:aspartate/methionine/tyrosine aminotransferase